MTRKTRSPKVHRQVLDPTEVQKGVRTTGTSETLQKNREGVRGKIPNSKVQKNARHRRPPGWRQGMKAALKISRLAGRSFNIRTITTEAHELVLMLLSLPSFLSQLCFEESSRPNSLLTTEVQKPRAPLMDQSSFRAVPAPYHAQSGKIIR